MCFYHRLSLSLFPSTVMDSVRQCNAAIINPRRACAARVIVVGFVCVSVKSHLTSRMSNRAINDHAYSVACERQKICGDFPEKTAFKSYAAKHEFTGLPAVSFFRSTHSEAAEVTQRVSTTFSPKLILLARVGARTNSTAQSFRQIERHVNLFAG